MSDSTPTKTANNAALFATPQRVTDLDDTVNYDGDWKRLWANTRIPRYVLGLFSDLREWVDEVHPEYRFTCDEGAPTVSHLRRCLKQEYRFPLDQYPYWIWLIGAFYSSDVNDSLQPQITFLDVPFSMRIHIEHIIQRICIDSAARLFFYALIGVPDAIYARIIREQDEHCFIPAVFEYLSYSTDDLMSHEEQLLLVGTPTSKQQQARMLPSEVRIVLLTRVSQLREELSKLDDPTSATKMIKALVFDVKKTYPSVRIQTMIDFIEMHGVFLRPLYVTQKDSFAYDYTVN